LYQTEPFTGVTTRTYKVVVEEELFDRLIRTASKKDTSLFVLIVCAYVKTIAGFDCESNEFTLNLPTGGKIYPNVDATDIIGCFAQNLSVAFTRTLAEDNWDNLIDTVKTNLTELFMSDLDKKQIKAAASNARAQNMLVNGEIQNTIAAFIRNSMKSNLYLSYVGESHLNRRYGGVEILEYAPFTCTNPHTIDNVMEIFQNNLVITSNFDAGFVDENFIKSLLSTFVENLNVLAAEAFDKVGKSTFKNETVGIPDAEIIKVCENILKRKIEA
jgi:hypothetical protein